MMKTQTGNSTEITPKDYLMMFLGQHVSMAIGELLLDRGRLIRACDLDDQRLTKMLSALASSNCFHAHRVFVEGKGKRAKLCIEFGFYGQHCANWEFERILMVANYDEYGLTFKTSVEFEDEICEPSAYDGGWDFYSVQLGAWLTKRQYMARHAI